jgi:hypothetical protein
MGSCGSCLAVNVWPTLPPLAVQRQFTVEYTCVCVIRNDALHAQTFTPPLVSLVPKLHSRYYCPAASTTTSGGPCPAGTYRGLTDAVDACKLCAAPAVAVGSYCPGGGTLVTTTSQGVPCPAGTYISPTAIVFTTCSACSVSPGSYCPAGSSTVGGVLCPAGSFSGVTGVVTTCSPCTVAAGSYCPAGSLSAAGSQCPAGQFSSSTGALAACTDCPVGSYASSAGRSVR